MYYVVSLTLLTHTHTFTTQRSDSHGDELSRMTKVDCVHSTLTLIILYYNYALFSRIHVYVHLCSSGAPAHILRLPVYTCTLTG